MRRIARQNPEAGIIMVPTAADLRDFGSAFFDELVAEAAPDGVQARVHWPARGFNARAGYPSAGSAALASAELVAVSIDLVIILGKGVLGGGGGVIRSSAATSST